MGDATGNVVGEHWTLLGMIVGFLVGLAAIGYKAKRVFRDEVHEGLVLSLTNSGGDLIKSIVHGAVTEAMSRHEIVCPHKDRLARLEERVRQMELLPP